jgi:hypothetical protein
MENSPSQILNCGNPCSTANHALLLLPSTPVSVLEDMAKSTGKIDSRPHVTELWTAQVHRRAVNETLMGHLRRILVKPRPVDAQRANQTRTQFILRMIKRVPFFPTYSKPSVLLSVTSPKEIVPLYLAALRSAVNARGAPRIVADFAEKLGTQEAAPGSPGTSVHQPGTMPRMRKP